jgi:hypothetical protein
MTDVTDIATLITKINDLAGVTEGDLQATWATVRAWAKNLWPLLVRAGVRAVRVDCLDITGATPPCQASLVVGEDFASEPATLQIRYTQGTDRAWVNLCDPHLPAAWRMRSMDGNNSGWDGEVPSWADVQRVASHLPEILAFVACALEGAALDAKSARETAAKALAAKP